MMLFWVVILGYTLEPNNLSPRHSIIHPFFLNFILLLKQNISFFDLVLVNGLILFFWILNFEFNVLYVFDKSDNLLSFDLHMVLKLSLVHHVLMGQAVGVTSF